MPKLHPHLIFSDKITFHLSEKVNKCNVRIWVRQNSRTTTQHERLNEAECVLWLITNKGFWTIHLCGKRRKRNKVPANVVTMVFISTYQRFIKLHFLTLARRSPMIFKSLASPGMNRSHRKSRPCYTLLATEIF